MLMTATAPTTVNPETPIAVMQRCELKYILNPTQEALLKQAMEGRMEPVSTTGLSVLIVRFRK